MIMKARRSTRLGYVRTVMTSLRWLGGGRACMRRTSRSRFSLVTPQTSAHKSPDSPRPHQLSSTLFLLPTIHRYLHNNHPQHHSNLLGVPRTPVRTYSREPYWVPSIWSLSLDCEPALAEPSSLSSTIINNSSPTTIPST